MKTKLFSLLLITATSLPLFAASEAKENYIAHEWGTFTSVQGSDGIPMEWNPFTTAELPSFVYDYKKPSGDPGRQLALLNWGGKGAFRTLQRMETPVIYFYSDKERTVDVTVKFPEGRITEWFPQARDIGPSSFETRGGKPDNTAKPIGWSGVNASALDTKKGIAESLIRWPDVNVLPAREHEGLQKAVPSDSSGNHYYAARATDADFLRVSAGVKDTSKPEHEKFLFYRGVGNFKTPLQVSGDGEQFLSLRNTGTEALTQLFVLQVRNGEGRLISVGNLMPGKDRLVPIEAGKKPLPVSDLVSQISEAMRAALVKEGLYEREATAMVNTWRDSWFEEQGVRVLYLLPRSWTDRVLPLTVDPQPREIVRVMVGRAEVITPRMEWELLKQIVRYSEADTTTREQVVQNTRKLGLGRFAEPTTRRLATKLPSGEFNRFSTQLLEAASKAEKAGKTAKTLAQR